MSLKIVKKYHGSNHIFTWILLEKKVFLCEIWTLLLFNGVKGGLIRAADAESRFPPSSKYEAAMHLQQKVFLQQREFF